MADWNKLIDFSLFTKTPETLSNLSFSMADSLGRVQTPTTYSAVKNTEIIFKCPRKGIKPHIEISGTITGGDTVSTFELRCTNLYTDRILPSQYQQIQVSAGYESGMSLALVGDVMNIYTANPGPDKITVIQCAVANMNAWLNRLLNISLDAGFSIDDAVKKITDALGFDKAYIDESVSGLTCVSPFEFNGLAKQAVTELKQCFPEVDILPENNRLTVMPQDRKQASGIKNHVLQYLTQAPQYSGGAVTINAPWNPTIAPGDIVMFPTNFYQSTLKTDVNISKAKVVSVQFSFSTVGDTNEMIISAVAA